MTALQFSRFVLKSSINVMNLRNASGILRKLKIWRGKRHILQAGSPLLQKFWRIHSLIRSLTDVSTARMR